MNEYICEFKEEDNSIQLLQVKGELVRYIDCEYSEEDCTHMFCGEHYHKVYEDDYCSSGKRKGNHEETTIDMLGVFLDSVGLKDPTGMVDAVRRNKK